MTAVTCTPGSLIRTIEILQAAGQMSKERVVLWLAPASAMRQPMPVVEVYEPHQITDVDYFRLPPESLRALMSHLRSERLKIVAQVHSHPGRAFHSEADDEWAIVRHVGALSLVLPHFGRGTTPANFADRAVTYELSADDRWVRVPNIGPVGRIGVQS